MPSTTPFTAKEHFVLGTFTSNCSSGMTITTVSERWDSSWDNNLALAKLLDEASIDFMFPVARWVGNGGATNFHGNALESVTWATGLLAHTQKLFVFATIHAAMNHPVVVAKQLATVDQISDSRIGLNIVAGWNEPEYRAMGLTLPSDHETRYAYAQEWFDVVQRLWTHDGRFDWEGEHFHLEQVHGDPKPRRALPIVNAGGSQAGREFAVRNADYLFASALDLERARDDNARLRSDAAASGREIDVLTFAHVICRPTEREAQDYLQYTARDNVDREALDNTLRLQIAHSESFPHDVLERLRDRFAAGHGGYQLVGTPERVADGIQALQDAGFSGAALSFVNYIDEFPYFRDTVLPILDDRGIRSLVAA
ncbi:LLM class flavin-dependent oxidoreductase [Microbacterium sp. BR1]|uniref:LLM class flavin-dependent oxidoreductase n=1 Tax=Microbacterium sp. BR1 TaxID=1070896 RepID=UPI001E5A1BC8|nr:LLM class flavin-dependent oxidoreductase [Microbacterium sp. BR1]